MTVLNITSVSNPSVKEVCEFKQKKMRDESGKFLIEGAKMLREALYSGVEVDSVFATEAAYAQDRSLIDSMSIQKLYLVTDNVLSKLSEWKTPQGIVALVNKPKWNIDEFFKRDKLFSLVLDGVSDPGNIGTIIRTSEAAGIDCIFTTQGTADCYQSKALRASMGSIFRIPVFENFEKCGIIYRLALNGIKTLTTSLNGEDVKSFSVDFKKLAVVLGNEGSGVSQEFISNADALVRLPMEGKVESLNVAVCAGIIMYMLKISN